MAEQVLIVANPHAGSRSRAADVAQLEQLLVQRELEVRRIERLDDLPAAVSPLLSENRLRAVVCVGGDGTVAEVANRTPPGTPLAILPRGTENLLAKYLGQPFDPAGVCELVCRGERVQLDAGRAGGRLFLLMLSAGFDADVVRRLAERRCGNITHWNWVKPIWEAVRSYQYPELRIYCRDTARHEAPAARPDEADCVARWAFVVNLPCYARGLRLAPAALGTDGQLEVCTFRGGSLLAGLWYLLHTLLGRHHRLPDCRRMQGAAFRLEADEAVPYQIDGDCGGWLPVEVETLPGRLTILAPRQFAEQLTAANKSDAEGSRGEPAIPVAGRVGDTAWRNE